MKLLVLFLLASGAALAQDGAANIRLNGVVKGIRGETVQGEVSAVSANSGIQMRVATLSEGGAYELRVPAGVVTLTARADGYVSEQRELELTANDQNRRVNFNLAEAGSVTGHVVDAGGAPVPGARVWLTYPGEAQGWRRGKETGGEETDASGSFRIPVVAQNRPFVLHAEADTWLMSSSGNLRLSGEELQGVLLVLSPRGAIISGRVVDQTGQPAAGAVIHLRVVPGERGIYR